MATPCPRLDVEDPGDPGASPAGSVAASLIGAPGVVVGLVAPTRSLTAPPRDEKLTSPDAVGASSWDPAPDPVGVSPWDRETRSDAPLCACGQVALDESCGKESLENSVYCCQEKDYDH